MTDKHDELHSAADRRSPFRTAPPPGIAATALRSEAEVDEFAADIEASRKELDAPRSISST